MKPLADRFVGVRLEFYQLQGRRIKGDTADCYVFSPSGEHLAGNRCWKNGNGFTAEELLALADKAGGDAARRGILRLSWFLVNSKDYARDVTDKGALRRYRSPLRPVGEARKARRPLVRVDGKASELLEEHQTFLSRHVRQFWWTKGNPGGPARLVVFDSNRFPEDAKETNVTGRFPKGKIPAVMGVIDLSGGVELEKMSPVLDEFWRTYMARRPPNNIIIHRDNPNYSKKYEEHYEGMEESIRRLARERKLLAPGGRKLLAPGK